MTDWDQPVSATRQPGQLRYRPMPVPAPAARPCRAAQWRVRAGRRRPAHIGQSALDSSSRAVVRCRYGMRIGVTRANFPIAGAG